MGVSLMGARQEEEEHRPLLDLVETLEESNGYKDDDSFLAMADLELIQPSVRENEVWRWRREKAGKPLEH